MLLETFISLHKVGEKSSRNLLLLKDEQTSAAAQPFPLLVKTKQHAEISRLLLNVKFYFWRLWNFQTKESLSISQLVSPK